MRNVPRARRFAQPRALQFETSSAADNLEHALSSHERRRVQLGYLEVSERVHVLRLAQIRAERRALLAQVPL